MFTFSDFIKCMCMYVYTYKHPYTHTHVTYTHTHTQTHIQTDTLSDRQTLHHTTIHYNSYYNTLQYNTTQYTTRHNTIQHNTKQHNTIKIQYNRYIWLISCCIIIAYHHVFWGKVRRVWSTASSNPWASSAWDPQQVCASHPI